MDGVAARMPVRPNEIVVAGHGPGLRGKHRAEQHCGGDDDPFHGLLHFVCLTPAWSANETQGVQNITAL
jgi:hypothetical protein